MKQVLRLRGIGYLVLNICSLYPPPLRLSIGGTGSRRYRSNPALAAKHYAAARGTHGTINAANRIAYTRTNSIGSFGFKKDHWAGLPNCLERNPRRPNDYRGWYCMHFHGIADSKQNLSEGFEYLKEHTADVWGGLFREVALYGQERDTATLKVLSAGPDEIRLSLSDRMKDDWFDFPLTVKVRLDPPWKAIKATQRQKEAEARIVVREGSSYALVQVVPDRGAAVLKRGE